MVKRTCLYHCEPEVKRLFTTHNKCNKKISARLFSGSVIKYFLGLSEGLEDAKEYRVCNNVASLMKSFLSSQIGSPTLTGPPPQREICSIVSISPVQCQPIILCADHHA